jgi:DNA end-binding protein Ku
LPSRKRKHAADAKAAPEAKDAAESGTQRAAAPVRPIWTGTITFGLVSIPVELFSGVRPRQTAMKLVDQSGHALGRQYHCSKDGKKLATDDLVRGYPTDAGKMVVITDDEFDSLAPEMSGDIELRSFTPLDQVPPQYFQRPYFLAPAGKSAKAYHLLAATMERTGRIGIGNFVMRGHEYLVAILSDNGVLRADTLRYADEIRTPESIGLPEPGKVAAKLVNQFIKDLDALSDEQLNIAELEDDAAEALQKLAQAKQKKHEDVIQPRDLEEADAEDTATGAQIIDLMAVLKRSLSKTAVVTNADSGPPISLAERRARKTAKRKVPRKRATRAQRR